MIINYCFIDVPTQNNEFFHENVRTSWGKLYVTLHAKRAVSSKFSKLIFLVDSIAIFFVSLTERIFEKSSLLFVLYEILNILDLVMQSLKLNFK